MFGSIVARRSVLGATGLKPCLRTTFPALAIQRRLVQTRSITPQEDLAILNSQRQKRPSSPHFTIYQPQITWLASIANRGTGVFLSGALYVASIAYLGHGYFPSFDSAHLVQLASDLPTWLKGSVKLAFAAPFAFHTFNGIRHLAWDIGYGLTLRGVYIGGYSVIALTAVTSIYLAFFV